MKLRDLIRGHDVLDGRDDGLFELALRARVGVERICIDPVQNNSGLDRNLDELPRRRARVDIHDRNAVQGFRRHARHQQTKIKTAAGYVVLERQDDVVRRLLAAARNFKADRGARVVAGDARHRHLVLVNNTDCFSDHRGYDSGGSVADREARQSQGSIDRGIALNTMLGRRRAEVQHRLVLAGVHGHGHRDALRQHAAARGDVVIPVWKSTSELG